MTKLSRRLFLGGTLALAGARLTVGAERPILWGDLIHDDAPALNALFRGEPIRVMSGLAIEGADPVLKGARCLVSSPVLMTRSASIIGCELRTTEDYGHNHLLHVSSDDPASMFVVKDCLFDFRRAPWIPDNPGAAFALMQIEGLASGADLA